MPPRHVREHCHGHQVEPERSGESSLDGPAVVSPSTSVPDAISAQARATTLRRLPWARGRQEELALGESHGKKAAAFGWTTLRL
jgi:hypothetical protein